MASVEKGLQYRISRRGLGGLVLGAGVALFSEACFDSSSPEKSDLTIVPSITSVKGWKVRYIPREEIAFFLVPPGNPTFIPNKEEVKIDDAETGVSLLYSRRSGRGLTKTFPALFITGNERTQIKFLQENPDKFDKRINAGVVGFANIKDGSERYLHIEIKPQNEGFMVKEYSTPNAS